MPIGERIKDLRKKAKMNQEDLGAILEVTGAAVGSYERGKREPSIESIKKMCEIFNVTSDYLLGMTDDRYATVRFNSKVELQTLLEVNEHVTLYNHELSKDEKQRIIDVSSVMFATKNQTDNMDV